MNQDYKLIIDAATKAIIETLEAGERQRIDAGKPIDQWKTYPPERRLHHAFMHLVACKTHEGSAGNPWVLAKDTGLEQWKHALCGLAIVACHELGYLESDASVLDTTEDEVKGE